MDYFDIDVYSRPVTTGSKDAQLWFDRGLVWCYAYCHEEASRCFQRAAEADPNCAMAHWGIAYAVGPNYNLPWHKLDMATRTKRLGEAFAATERARALRDGVTPPERALIDALPARYPQAEPLKDTTPWNVDFANAMRKVHQDFPDDLEIRAVFAEAILNITPWKMWDLASGAPAEGAGTLEAQAVLEDALDHDPRVMTHPGILHLYVHLMEMSPTPERALRAGDALRELVPDAGHLIHMPTHIDILCGHYRDVLHWNLRATKVDRAFYEQIGPYNIYTGYRLHNYHFAIYGAMFLGQFAPALEAAEEMVEITPEDVLKVDSPPLADFFESYLAMKPHVLIRFGKWQDILEEPMSSDPKIYCYRTALWHYAKGVAHAALGQVEAARDEQRLFLAARDRVPESRILHNNTCLDLLAIAEAMLEGEIAYRAADYDRAFAELRRAVHLEDTLPYDEPWGWMQPTRHALGALLLEQGHAAEAERAYREDLGLAGALSRATIHPDNVWALRGLAMCMERAGTSDTAEGRLIRQRLDIAAARSDIPVTVSCFCAGQAAAA